MENLSVITEFLGWCSLLNIGWLFCATMALTLLKTPVRKIHAWFFDIGMQEMELTYMSFLGNYKIAVLVFNIVPYLALKIMGV